MTLNKDTKPKSVLSMTSELSWHDNDNETNENHDGFNKWIFIFILTSESILRVRQPLLRSLMKKRKTIYSYNK